jgi:hypothetical protein
LTGETFDLEVVVWASHEAQSFELGFEADLATLSIAGIAPHPEFNEGSGFLLSEVDPQGGTVERVVDLRRGPNAIQGTFRVATLTLVASQAGVGTVHFTQGGLATPAGASFTISPVSAQITVVDP